MERKQLLLTWSNMAHAIELMPDLVIKARDKKRISLRTAAETMGIGHNALFRFERGHTVRQDSLIAIMHWLDAVNGPPA